MLNTLNIPYAVLDSILYAYLVGKVFHEALLVGYVKGQTLQRSFPWTMAAVFAELFSSLKLHGLLT